MLFELGLHQPVDRCDPARIASCENGIQRAGAVRGDLTHTGLDGGQFLPDQRIVRVSLSDGQAEYLVDGRAVTELVGEEGGGALVAE